MIFNSHFGGKFRFYCDYLCYCYQFSSTVNVKKFTIFSLVTIALRYTCYTYVLNIQVFTLEEKSENEISLMCLLTNNIITIE